MIQEKWKNNLIIITPWTIEVYGKKICIPSYTLKKLTNIDRIKDVSLSDKFKVYVNDLPLINLNILYAGNYIPYTYWDKVEEMFGKTLCLFEDNKIGWIANSSLCAAMNLSDKEYKVIFPDGMQIVDNIHDPKIVDFCFCNGNTVVQDGSDGVIFLDIEKYKKEKNNFSDRDEFDYCEGLTFRKCSYDEILAPLSPYKYNNEERECVFFESL